MDKKYLMNGLAALALLAGFSSCVKDVDSGSRVSPEDTDKTLKEAASLNYGLNIPDGQTWDMTTQVSANVNVNLTPGETYSVAVYANDPIADKKGVYLTKGTVKNGGTFTSTFTVSSGAQSFVVGATDSKGITRFTDGTVKNGVLTADFGAKNAASRSMRSITVGKDTYDTFNFPTEEELAAAFPSAIPGDAEEIAVDGDYHYYLNRGEGHNYKLTSAGTYNIGGSWQNTDWVDGHTVYHFYNIYISVDGDVTLKRNGAAHFNLYILKGNVTLVGNYGEQAGLISVAPGATLNDQRNSIAANGGIKLFNRGTIKATNTEKYDIGNNSTVYNEGVFEAAGPLTYSPGAGNTSYFINKGDGKDETVDLKAPSMTLNSTCHFYTEGKTEIAGLTSVTQSGIVWINNGHYTTGSMKFSAHNGTFYNYCQLLVSGECDFLDGMFNMMTGSYAEFGKGLFNNFHVNMYDNSTINIKDGTKFGRQGAGIMQGFYAVDNNAKAYVRLGGHTQVPAHKGAALHISGAKLTFAYEKMTFYDGTSTGTSFDGTSYWTEVTKEQLIARGDENTTWEQHEGATYTQSETVEITTPTDLECTGQIEEKVVPVYEEPVVYSFAFEDRLDEKTDYDLNDVVLQISFPVTARNSKGQVTKIDSTKLNVTLVASGAEFQINAYIGQTKLFGKEVHEALGKVNDPSVAQPMINTGRISAKPVSTQINVPDGWDGDFNNLDVWIYVNEDKAETTKSRRIIKYLEDREKVTPYAIMVPGDWRWPIEQMNIWKAYPGKATDTENVYETEYSFKTWAETAERTDAMKSWFNNPVEGLTFYTTATE